MKEKANAISCCLCDMATGIDIQIPPIPYHENENTSNEYKTGTTIFTVGNTTASTSFLQKYIEISLEKRWLVLYQALSWISVSQVKKIIQFLMKMELGLERNFDVTCDNIKDLSKIEEGGV